MIRIEELRKDYGDIAAVAGISLTAEAGAVFGLLGPNGAGKSTTIGCISGLVEPTAGRVSVLGHDLRTDGRKARAELGIVPQELALYEDLSATENLVYWGSAYGMRGASLKARIDEILNLIELGDRAKEPVKGFSGGMKRRLNFACGVVHRPRVLLLDEPTVGVDPQSRVRLLDLVREQAAAGVTVLYTTHYMEEAETLCDRLAIVDHGKIIAEGSLADLQALMSERDVLQLTGRIEVERLDEALGSLDAVEIVLAEDELLTLAVKNGPQALPAVLSQLAAIGCVIRESTMKQPSLESLFIKLTGRELRD